MRIAFALVFALVSSCAGAAAADLQLKAPAAAAVPACTVLSCSGVYVGGNVTETGGNFNVISTGLSGLSNNSLQLGGDVGYQFWNGKWFIAGEVDAQYGIVQNGALPGGGNSALWALGGLVKVGYDISGLLGASTQGATPTLPSSLANALISPYVILGVWDRKWGAGFASGAGVQALLAANWTISADYIHVNYNNANVNPIVSQQTEDLVRVAVDYHFAVGR